MSDTFKKVINFIKEYGNGAWYSIILSLVVSFIGLYIPIVIANCVDLCIGKGQVDIFSLKEYLVIIMALAIAYGIINWLLDFVNNKIAFDISRSLRNKLVKKIETFPMAYIDKMSHGDLVSKVILDVDQVSDGIFMGFTKVMTGVFQVIFTIVFMFMINKILAIVAIVLTPISIVIASKISRQTYDLFVEQSNLRGMQTAYVNEIIKNERTVISCNEEKNAINTFNSLNMKLEDVSIDALFYSSIVNPTSRCVNNIIYAILTLLGAYFCIRGSLTIGMLTCMLAYASKYQRPFNEIASVASELQNAIASLDRITNVLAIDSEEEIETEVIEKEYSIYTEDNVEVELDPNRDIINLEKVSFGYEVGQRVIKNLNLAIKNREKIAIVGETGCGKTTLINLIMRFYNPLKGKILFDSKDVKKINKKEYRQNFGMVLQDTFIKSGTILDNIKMGKKDATIEEVIEAAKNANSYSFIEKLPDGFETKVSNHDGILSEGERQLIAITRVMLQNPDILILDEATSNIDIYTERKVQEAFDKLMENKTSIVIAHRLSTIRNSDRVIALDNLI